MERPLEAAVVCMFYSNDLLWQCYPSEVLPRAAYRTVRSTLHQSLRHVNEATTMACLVDRVLLRVMVVAPQVSRPPSHLYPGYFPKPFRTVKTLAQQMGPSCTGGALLVRMSPYSSGSAPLLSSAVPSSTTVLAVVLLFHQFKAPLHFQLS